MPGPRRISVFLADDNLIVREGVRALLAMEPDFEVVGTAADLESTISGAEERNPQVLVTDIRMPPNFQREGIDAAKELRKRHPGTGVVVLSQFDDPEYAISLLSEGSSGYAYLLKDRVADGDQLFRAIREVAGGGSMLDPTIVAALVQPVTSHGGLTALEEDTLRMVAEGKTIKAIAAAQDTTAAAVDDAVQKLFLKLAQQASSGTSGALRRLRMLHQAIVQREELGESLSRLLPGGVAEKVMRQGRRPGDSERVVVTILMSDIRGYSTIAEHADATAMASQLGEHRAEMNQAVLDAGGTVMQFVGDAVMATFGDPLPLDAHADRAVDAARGMHARQSQLNKRWDAAGLPPFWLGMGLSTGEVAAALLGSEERLEYTLVGDTVNLSQRLQQWAGPRETVLSEATYAALRTDVDTIPIDPALVKGRDTPVRAYRICDGSTTP